MKLESLFIDPLDGASSPVRADLPRGETQVGHQKISMGAPKQPLITWEP